jgi:hypothetical protein
MLYQCKKGESILNMPYQIEWYVRAKVILNTNTGSITNSEGKQSDGEMIAMIESSTSEHVHVIVDIEQLEHLPSMPTILNLQWPKHPKLGWIVLVGIKRASMRTITMIAATLFRQKYHVADSLHDAMAFLRSLDSTLSDT